MKAKVDKEGCIGCALCVETCPKVFKLGDDGLSEVICDEVPSDVIESCNEAKDICPVDVISLT